MTTVSRLARATAALVAGTAVLVGIPVALVAMAGWPLPTRMPDWDNVYWAARQGNVPAEFVVKALACVVWLAWLQVVWALLWELCVNVPRIGQGRAELPTPLAPAPVSRLARRIVSAVLLFTTLASTPAMTVAAPPLSSFTAATAPPMDGAAVAELVGGAKDTARAPAAASTWRAVDGDTLWQIAERCLGDGGRVDDIVRCNPYLVPSRPLRDGQVIELPAGVTAPPDRAGTPLDRADSPLDATPTPDSTATADAATVHTVVDNDTLWNIVRDHYGAVDKPTVNAIATYNGIADADVIFPDQQVELPSPDTLARLVDTDPTGTADAATVYTVVDNDTLWNIVRDHYGAVDRPTVNAIATYNGIPDAHVIFPDQQVELPSPDTLATLVDTDSTDAQTPPVASEPAEPSVAAPEHSETPDVSSEAPEPWPAPDSTPTAHDSTEDTDAGRRPQAPDSPPTAPAGAEAPTIGTPPSTIPVASPTPLPITTPADAQRQSADGASRRPADAVPVAAASEVDSGDVLGSRWLFGTLAASSLALGGGWVTLHQLRRRRRRWLGVTPPPTTAPESTERELRAQHDLAALGELVDRDLATGANVRGVLLREATELRFRQPAPEPPSGWDGDSTSWWRVDPDEPGPRILSPALVTIGHSADTGDVVLDLATAGAVSVTGDRIAVERLMCSMLWELAACPLGVPVDLYVVGLACAAEQHAANRARLLALDEAVHAAIAPHGSGEPVRVFLVDPFAASEAPVGLADLVDACAAGSGKAVVIAGPCGQPVEEVSVPDARRCVWNDLVLEPPQLTDKADSELEQLLAAVSVGRRSPDTTTTAVPDADAEAVALRATATMLNDEPDSLEPRHDHTDDGDDGCDRDDRGLPPTAEPTTPASSSTLVGAAEVPEVILTVCGRTVCVIGQAVPQATSIVFVLASAGRAMHTQELCELTGYAPKSLSTVFTASHPLVERDAGTLRLRDHVWTDHHWASECVRRLAAAMQDAPDSPDTMRWTHAASAALRALEQGPYAVLPTSRERSRATASAWSWVDEFPADVPARAEAETEVAEAALAFSELWLAAPVAHTVLSPSELAAELCRLAGLVPYANVTRQVRQSPWVTGAECLLTAAAEVASDDERALTRVQQTARAMAAREQLVASHELAEALGL